jgi:threonine dehydrogenase-like Zn-dependent dehydrogenase/predicted NBD/HSP70 family sugar kinase
VSAAAVVVDVGGTSTRVGLARDGRVVGQVLQMPTPSPRTGTPAARARDELMDLIAEHAQQLRAKHRAEVVGVAFGAVVTTSGVVRNASVLWLEPSTGFDVAGALRARLPWASVRVLNDVSAAAWHYRALGRFALVTVSTGVAIKVFDAGLPWEKRLVLDADGVGGEAGHTVVDPAAAGRPGARELGRAAAAGDRAAAAELERLGLPWCECGAVADLCSFTSGPAVIRAAAAWARRRPELFAGSVLAELTSGDPSAIDAAALAAAAAPDDAFTGVVLCRATRPLAARLLQVCADLGLRKVVVVGGFATGVGQPWLRSLRRNLGELIVDAGWFTGWTTADLDELVTLPPDAPDAPLAGMAAYLDEQPILEAVKPVGAGRLVLRAVERPACGREQFLLRPLFAGVCGTDLQILRGERGCEPGVPGHEVVAEVVEVGSHVTGLEPGEVVGLNPNNPLDDGDKLGHNRPGVFTQLIVGDVGLHRRGQVVPLPRTAGASATLLEPLAAVLRAQDMTAAHAPARRVLVVGTGVAGLLHAALARHRGAETVLIAGRSPARLRRTVTLGLCAPEHAIELGPDLQVSDVDTAIVAVSGGAGAAVVERLWPALADGAVVHLFGGFAAGDTVAAVPVGPLRATADSARVRSPVGRDAVLVGSRGGRRADYLAAAELPLGDVLDRLVSHIVPLRTLPDVAAELAAHGTVGGEHALRVVVDMAGGR